MLQNITKHLREYHTIVIIKNVRGLTSIYLICGSEVAKFKPFQTLQGVLLLILYNKPISQEGRLFIMLHCVNFKHNKVLYLFDNKDFRHRFIKVGYCPICKRTVIELFEERKADGKQFIETKVGIEAINFLTKVELNIDYSTERKKEHNLPLGWVYGINTENKDGQIKQFSCDFRGNRELIKVFSS